MSTAPVTDSNDQKKHARRTAVLLILLAVAVYFGFIIATGMKG